MPAHMLHLRGIASVVLEARSRQYVEGRVRAGVLEHGTRGLLIETGVGERLKLEGLLHHGIKLSFGGRHHRIDMTGLTGGRSITVYAQHELIKDLIQARLKAGGQILFESPAVSVHGLDGAGAVIRFRSGGESELQELACDFIAGCDGNHGMCRPSLPQGALAGYERIYPFAWLGILAEAPPASDELVYTYHERGFALFSMRSPQITRLYLQ